MKKIISIVKDERIVAIVGKTMTAMIYERCTLVTLPFILPPTPTRNVNTICHKAKLQCKANPSLVAIFLPNKIHHHGEMEATQRTEMLRDILNCNNNRVILGNGNDSEIDEHWECDRPLPIRRSKHNSSPNLQWFVCLHKAMSTISAIKSQPPLCLHLPQPHVMGDTGLQWPRNWTCTGASWWPATSKL